MSMNEMRILLVDDHVLFRKGIASLLARYSDLIVVGEASDGVEAVDKARALLPDVILMDISMPLCDGLEATRRIKQEMPQVKILMLTIADDDQHLFAAIKEGADGYLLKNLEPNQLYDMIDGLRQGEVAMTGIMAAKILKEFRHPHADTPISSAIADELSHREFDVLERIAMGESNKEIGDELGITQNTVKIHLRNILDKLHVQNRVQAAVYAVRQGLVQDHKLPDSPIE